MSMYIVPIPHFDSEMSVMAYWLHSHNGKKMLGVKDNFLRLDEAFSHPGLSVVEEVGIEPFTGDKQLFVPLTRMQLLAGLMSRVKLDRKRLVCVVPAECVADQECAAAIQKLSAAGYGVAIEDFPPDVQAAALAYVSYIILNCRQPGFPAWYQQTRQLFPDKRLIIAGILDMTVFEGLRQDTGAYFTGSFYRQPVTKKNVELSPLKINALRLLNDINQEDFELEDTVRIIERDPYLSVSLLKFLNSSASGLRRQVDSIQQAVAYLGQKAMRQWAMIALSASLGADRPGEITRLALLRAKFAEDIAEAFDLAVQKPSLFMAGLFSLLDIMLEKPMPDAIREVAVSEPVRAALVEKQGPLAPVMELIYAYERADWDRVSILMIQNHTDMEHVSKAYLDALIWYRNLLRSIDMPAR